MGTVKISIRYSLYSVDEGAPGFTPLHLINLLTSLPPGTKVVGFEELPQVALSRDFNLIIDNPIFVDSNEVIDQDNAVYTRRVGVTEKGRIVQFNEYKGLDLEKVLRKSIVHIPATKEYVDKISAPIPQEDLDKLSTQAKYLDVEMSKNAWKAPDYSPEEMKKLEGLRAALEKGSYHPDPTETKTDEFID